MVNYEEAYKKVKNALDEVHWYDRKVYDLISDGTKHKRAFQKKPNISITVYTILIEK